MYKTVEYVLAKDEVSKRPAKYKLFKDAPLEEQKMFEIPKNLQSDGMIKVGAKLKKLTPVIVLYEVAKKTFKTFFNKESEACSVDSVIITGSPSKNA